MATMAPMIAPKGTEVSWNGGNVEKSPEPRNSSFARWNVGKVGNYRGIFRPTKEHFSFN